MGRGRVPSEKTKRLDTPAGGRRPCPPRRNPAAGPGADGLGVPPETGHRRETEPHHQTQNQPAGHPNRRPGDQPAGRPRRRPSVRRDGTPPADPGQPAGRPRRRPGIGQDRVPPPAPGPTGWVSPPEAASAETKPRRRTRNRRPAGRPPPEPGARPGRNPAAGPGPDRLGVVGWRASVLRVGFVCPVGGIGHGTSCVAFGADPGRECRAAGASPAVAALSRDGGIRRCRTDIADAQRASTTGRRSPNAPGPASREASGSTATYGSGERERHAAFGALTSDGSAFCATSTSAAKAPASFTASSARILRSTSMFAAFRP